VGELLGIGCPHGPQPRFTDETMANNYFRHNLLNERTPARWKDPANWPPGMRAEWGEDEGATAGRKHRAAVIDAYCQARAKLDAFQPDVVVMFGDDQYENFKEDCFPPFCVYANDAYDLKLKGDGTVRRGENGLDFGIPMERPPLQATAQGDKRFGTHLAAELINQGFDVACSWKLHHLNALGHAFTFTLDYLDWDRKGFPYPLIPFHVSAYGEDTRMPIPGVEHVAGRLPQQVPPDAVLPPPSPPAWRCYDLGKAVGEICAASPYRVAIIGTASWSHASLTGIHGFVWGDVDEDRRRYEELKAGQQHRWRDLDGARMRAAGQHEMRNWICLAGAMEGRRAEIITYAETYIFNSCKCIAVFPANAEVTAGAGAARS
jgi:hypothetical protein